MNTMLIVWLVSYLIIWGIWKYERVWWWKLSIKKHIWAFLLSPLVALCFIINSIYRYFHNRHARKQLAAMLKRVREKGDNKTKE